MKLPKFECPGHLEWWSGDGIPGFDADIHPGTITHWAEIDPPYV